MLRFFAMRSGLLAGTRCRLACRIDGVLARAGCRTPGMSRVTAVRPGEGETMWWHERRRGGQKPDDLITASEIASFAYCPEAWRLEHGLGLPAENRAALDAGTRHHGRKAAAERIAGLAIALG